MKIKQRWRTVYRTLSHRLRNSKTSERTEYNFDLFAKFVASYKPTKNRGPAKIQTIGQLSNSSYM
jgi:hypothetical protein